MAISFNLKNITDGEKVFLETANLCSQNAGMTVNGCVKINGTWEEVGIKKDNQKVKEIGDIKPLPS